jgi:hypothetical protein
MWCSRWNVGYRIRLLQQPRIAECLGRPDSGRYNSSFTKYSISRTLGNIVELEFKGKVRMWDFEFGKL